MQFYWLTTFGVIAGDPEFCQIWGWCWNINKNISFHFRLLPRKTNDKIFQKSKKPYLGTCGRLAFFAQIWAKMNFPEKKSLSVFKYSNYLRSCQKSDKTNCHSWGKCWSDGWIIFFSSFSSRDTIYLKILQSDSLKAFWHISQESNFSKFFPSIQQLI